MLGEGTAKDGVFVRMLGEGLEGSAGADGVAAEDAALRSSRTTTGFSKSHGTPCFTQLPHFGWISSHYKRGH